MKELTDMTNANSQGLGRALVQRWRLFVLFPLLLVAFGCGGGGGEGGTDPATGTPPATGTALPDDVAGKWQTTLTYVPGYYTGIVGNADFIGSLGIILYFQSNGSYQFDLQTASTYYNGNCFRTTQWSEVGKASLAGADLTFTSTHATNMVTDSCGKFQYVDPAPTGTATYTMSREQDQAGRAVLRLRMPNGDDLVLQR